MLFVSLENTKESLFSSSQSIAIAYIYIWLGSHVGLLLSANEKARDPLLLPDSPLLSGNLLVVNYKDKKFPMVAIRRFIWFPTFVVLKPSEFFLGHQTLTNWIARRSPIPFFPYRVSFCMIYLHKNGNELKNLNHFSPEKWQPVEKRSHIHALWVFSWSPNTIQLAWIARRSPIPFFPYRVSLCMIYLHKNGNELKNLNHFSPEKWQQVEKRSHIHALCFMPFFCSPIVLGFVAEQNLMTAHWGLRPTHAHGLFICGHVSLLSKSSTYHCSKDSHSLPLIGI